MYLLFRLTITVLTEIQKVLDWYHDDIAYPKTSKLTLQVNYYPHKRWSDVYYSGNHLCVIHVSNYDTIQAVTNSVIREYVHAQQRNKNYDKMMKNTIELLGHKSPKTTHV